METKQFELIMQGLNQVNQRINQMDEKFEKKFEQTDIKFKAIDERFNDLEKNMGLGFMRLEKKIDDYYDMCTRQHADLLGIIEKRVQESKNDRESLHQGQEALKFRVEQLEINSKVV